MPNPGYIAICNISLSRVGAGSISDFDGLSEPARQCELLYDLAKDSLLESQDWTFASVRKPLALTDEVYTGWSYAYVVPSNNLILRRIVDPLESSAYQGGSIFGNDGVKGIPFKEVTISDLNQKRILTNYADAEMEYTARVEDTNLMSPNFILDLTYWLGAQLAIPLKGDIQKHQDLMTLHQAFLDNAKALNANVDNHKPEQESSFVKARRG